jgi:hypothetical protein
MNTTREDENLPANSKKKIETMAEWFEARDLFLGQSVDQDMALGLELARRLVECGKCEDAEWLCKLFPTVPESPWAARSVFMALGDSDARGLVFGALVAVDEENVQDENGFNDEQAFEKHMGRLLKGAKLGCALGAAGLCKWNRCENELLDWAASEPHNEPYALYTLAFQYQNGQV